VATEHEFITPQEPWRLGNPSNLFFKSMVDLSAPEFYSDVAQA
jgi:hypothetical protein